MHVAQAHAVRRAALVGAGLVATIGAHVAAAGGEGLHILPVAPLIWSALVAVAVVCGPRAHVYAPRGPLSTLVALIAAQMAFHVAASLAPWTLGFGGSGMRMSGVAMLTAGALWPHVVAAVLLGVVLVRADRWLARTVARVRQAVAALVTAHTWPRPARLVPAERHRLTAQVDGGARPGRGPPPVLRAALA
jgi:hypothetical protein